MIPRGEYPKARPKNSASCGGCAVRATRSGAHIAVLGADPSGPVVAIAVEVGPKLMLVGLHDVDPGIDCDFVADLDISFHQKMLGCACLDSSEQESARADLEPVPEEEVVSAEIDARPPGVVEFYCAWVFVVDDFLVLEGGCVDGFEENEAECLE